MKKIYLLFIPLVLLIACSKVSETELMESAKQLIDNNNLTEAITIYEQIIDEYPESENTPKALVALAGIYQSKGDKTISDVENLNKAIQYYEMVYNKFPQSNDAPVSLFMIGYIQANELKNFDEATKNYNTFLEKYPNHEMAVAARQELDFMGLSPEEILNKKLADTN